MIDYSLLIKEAAKARLKSYSPYSGFKVGAALITKSGKIYTGCNIENAAYGDSVCAERVAFFKAVSGGEKEFCAIAIVGGRGEVNAECPPCGTCRQVMKEFCGADFEIVLGTDKSYKIYTLDAILPLGFNENNLE